MGFYFFLLFIIEWGVNKLPSSVYKLYEENNKFHFKIEESKFYECLLHCRKTISKRSE